LVTTVTERAQLSIVLAKPARWASQPRATMSRSRLTAVAGRAVEQRGTVVLVEPLQLGLHAEHTAGQDHPVGHSDPTSNRRLPGGRRTRRGPARESRSDTAGVPRDRAPAVREVSAGPDRDSRARPPPWRPDSPHCPARPRNAGSGRPTGPTRGRPRHHRRRQHRPPCSSRSLPMCAPQDRTAHAGACPDPNRRNVRFPPGCPGSPRP